MHTHTHTHTHTHRQTRTQWKEHRGEGGEGEGERKKGKGEERKGVVTSEEVGRIDLTLRPRVTIMVLDHCDTTVTPL
jgi:hypothetical protein